MMKMMMYLVFLVGCAGDATTTSSTTTSSTTSTTVTTTATTYTTTTTDTEPWVGIDTKIDGQLCINEFLASNLKSLPGPKKDYPDWIELYNPTHVDISLSGYYISDHLDDYERHELGDVTVPSGGFLVLWADNDTELGADHLSFELNNDGEGVGLYRPDGSSIDKITWDKALTSDWSVARKPDDCGDSLEHDATPTPGETNSDG